MGSMGDGVFDGMPNGSEGTSTSCTRVPAICILPLPLSTPWSTQSSPRCYAPHLRPWLRERIKTYLLMSRAPEFTFATANDSVSTKNRSENPNMSVPRRFSIMGPTAPKNQSGTCSSFDTSLPKAGSASSGSDGTPGPRPKATRLSGLATETSPCRYVPYDVLLYSSHSPNVFVHSRMCVRIALCQTRSLPLRRALRTRTEAHLRTATRQADRPCRHARTARLSRM